MPLTHVLRPPVGGSSALQSVLVDVQAVLQRSGFRLASHWNAPQLTAGGVAQVPMPLHVLAGIRASDSDIGTPPTVPATVGAHAGGAHTTPAFAT